MTEPVLGLLEEFAARRARGERPDPLDFLRRAGAGADLLADRIDRLVQSLPPPPPAAADVARMRALIDAEPPLLSLRLARRLRLQEVAGALVVALGLPTAAVARVRERYHELESGRLDPARLDGRLRAAVADALGVAESRLPTAPIPPPPAAEAAGMARGAPPELGWPEIASMTGAGDVAPASRARDVDDEVDRLFGVG